MSSRAIRRALLVAALAGGLLAPLAGSPFGGRAAFDARRLAEEVTREEDHVTALELAAWIRDRRPGLRVVDVRSAAEFARYHLPTARNLELPALVRESFPADATVVLVSGGGAHAAQGWVLLRAAGLRSVYFLRGGVDEWIDEVMNPTLARDAPPAERAEFERISALARYFGGVPRLVDAPAAGRSAEGGAPGSKGPAATAADRLAWRRRGC